MASTPQDIKSTAQQYLDIFDISNDLLILKDGTTSLILQVHAINFGLLSEPEQDAIIYAYAALINSLSFPIEIVIKSQPKDVTRYLEYIDEQLEKAPNELRQRQIAQYRQFVSDMITEQNVLDKTFYVVLPLTGLELGVVDSLNPLNSVTKGNKPASFDKYSLIEKAKNILIPRRDHMISQFGRIGVLSRQLNTKEIIHLFYTAYNFEAAEGARIVNSREYTSAVIQAQSGPITFEETAPQAPPINVTNQFQSATMQAEPPNSGSFAPDPLPNSAYNNSNNGSAMNLNNISAVPQESTNPTNAR